MVVAAPGSRDVFRLSLPIHYVPALDPSAIVAVFGFDAVATDYERDRTKRLIERLGH